MSIKWTLDKFKYKNKKPPYNKVCFGMGGQYGDIIMQEPGLRKFIESNPGTKIVLAVCDKYKDIQPLFYNYHEDIIDFKIWQGYDDWPTESDLNYINNQNFDAMFPFEKPRHEQPDWAKYRHIVEETALMLGVETSTNKIELKMPENIVKRPNTIAVHLFSSKWPAGTRSISLEKQKAIVNYIKDKNYDVMQISAPHQPQIDGTIIEHGTYYDACINVLSCEFLVSCDSGMPFVASAYDHPVVGLFSSNYNTLVSTTKNWWPLNPNAIYLEAPVANYIENNKIFEAIDQLIEKTK